ncbi:MAG: DUF4337 family protein [Polyangiaceae bacterium]
MNEAREMLEHMEHAKHGDHKGPGRAIGITMALLGVMLAFCAAMVGSERTDLIKTMVEQSNRWGIYQSETTKLRTIEADLEMLRALTPSKAEAAKLGGILRAKRAASGKADSEDTAEIKDLIAESLSAMTDVLAPDPEDLTHFTALQRAYKQDMADAKENAEAYEGAIKAHESAAEWYERAQLASEIGIVIASVALLLSSRATWMLSLGCGAAGFVIICATAFTEHRALDEAERKIAFALQHEAEIEAADDDAPPAASAPSVPAASGAPGTSARPAPAGSHEPPQP